MASVPQATPELPEEGKELTDDQWWMLFDHMRIHHPTQSSRYGGPVEFIRRLREEEDPFRC